MAKRMQDFIDHIKYEVDDADMTRFTTVQYFIAAEEAVRDVKRTALMINPDFVQYKLGETQARYRAIGEVMSTGTASNPVDTGTGEAGTANTLVDINKTWVEDEWDGYTVFLTTGTGTGQSRIISSNTYSTITVEGLWTTSPDATSQYEIQPPDSVLFDTAMTSAPFESDMWENVYVKLTAGTGSGQELKVEKIQGGEITANVDWTTVPDVTSVYSVMGVKRDYALPSDFLEMESVFVDGEEISMKDPHARSTAKYKPSWCLVGDNLRIENLGGGEIIELNYIPTDTSISSTGQTIAYGDVFFDAIKYYIIMKLKGWNYEDLGKDAAFLNPIRAAMKKTMTDHNVQSNQHVTSDFEDFEG